MNKTFCVHICGGFFSFLLCSFSNLYVRCLVLEVMTSLFFFLSMADLHIFKYYFGCILKILICIQKQVSEISMMISSLISELLRTVH